MSKEAHDVPVLTSKNGIALLFTTATSNTEVVITVVDPKNKPLQVVLTGPQWGAMHELFHHPTLQLAANPTDTQTTLFDNQVTEPQPCTFVDPNTKESCGSDAVWNTPGGARCNGHGGYRVSETVETCAVCAGTCRKVETGPWEGRYEHVQRNARAVAHDAQPVPPLDGAADETTHEEDDTDDE